MNKNFIPKKKEVSPKIASDREIEKFKKLINYVVKAKKDGYVIEAFIIAYQLIQEIELPRLKERVLRALKLEKLIEYFRNEQNAYSANLQYVALTHDVELFELLEKARKLRNQIIHRIARDANLEKSKEKANKALRLVALDLLKAIHTRWTGDKPIPVLTLYTKGWNDCVAQTKKVIEEAFS